MCLHITTSLLQGRSTLWLKVRLLLCFVLVSNSTVQKTHDFVLGLDDEQYKSLHLQILDMDHFLTSSKAFSLASQEECHRTIVCDRDDKTEIVSFVVQCSAHDSADVQSLW